MAASLSQHRSGHGMLLNPLSLEPTNVALPNLAAEQPDNLPY